MNKKLLKSTLVVAMVAVAGYGGYKAYDGYAGSETDLLLANIEALAKTEASSSTVPCFHSSQIVEDLNVPEEVLKCPSDTETKDCDPNGYVNGRKKNSSEGAKGQCFD